MSQELKPCPFCGGKADTYCTASDYPDWHAQCTECGASADITGPYDLHFWNRRADPVLTSVGEAVALGYISKSALADLKAGLHVPACITSDIKSRTNQHPGPDYIRDTPIYDEDHVARLQAEIAALQQRLNVADEQIDILSGGLRLMTSFGSGTNIAGVKTVAKQTLNRAAGVALKADQATSQ